MKPVSSWNFTPYAPLDRPERVNSPYVCRLVPSENGCEIYFFDNGGNGESHTLFFRVKDGGEFSAVALGNAKKAVLNGLLPETDYEFYIERNGGAKSDTRFFRTGKVHGSVVNYIYPEDDTYYFSGRYLCSPCLCRLPSGRLLSSMDVFEGNNAQNLTLIFYSDDNGESWNYLTELFPCFWGQMFYERGRLYMVGISNEYGDLLIGASDDEGKTWSLPTVLYRGSANTRRRGLHRAPMKFCRSHGRLWTDIEFGAWGEKEMNNAVLSAPEGLDDYTDPSVWVMTDFWRHNEFKKTAKEGEVLDGIIGGIEGNIVEAPDGKLYNFLRYARGKCLLLEVSPSEPEKMPTYSRLIDIGITPSKFDIVFDDVSKYYYAICSRAIDEPRTERNVLSLFRSPDLMSWECVYDIIDERNADPKVVGFQYVSFLIDENDIIFLCRTAYGRPHNFHDSNYQTFHRIKDFRKTGTEK